jgi:hypothetical protein
VASLALSLLSWLVLELLAWLAFEQQASLMCWLLA